MPTIRMNPADRKETILDAAMTATVTHGFSAVRQKHIAEAAECSYGLVTKYFKTMRQMRGSIMRRAIKSGLVDIVAQGFKIDDPDAKKACNASPDLKAKVLAAIAK